MIKIGLIADTHGYLDEQVFTHFAVCDEIWHVGDFGTLEIAEKLAEFRPFRGVFGNIDGREIRAVYPENLWFTCEGVKVWMTHIGGNPPKYKPGIISQLKEQKPNLFITGHSHILKVKPDPKLKVLSINPGAAGQQGFHKIRTLLRMHLENGEVKHLEAIELGYRGRAKKA